VVAVFLEHLQTLQSETQRGRPHPCPSSSSSEGRGGTEEERGMEEEGGGGGVDGAVVVMEAFRCPVDFPR